MSRGAGYLIRLDDIVWPKDETLWPKPVPFETPAMDEEDRKK